VLGGGLADVFLVPVGDDVAVVRKGETVTVDASYVERQLADIARNTDLSKYVL
jgi:ATP-dependent protease HslVU (ClpYQ) ATPase subunit